MSQSFFEVDPQYVPPAPTDRMAASCWQAHAILTSFMGEAEDLDEADLPDGVTGYSGEDGLAVHDTARVAIRSDRALFLSNLPYIANDRGYLMPVTEPGYVALNSLPAAVDPLQRVPDVQTWGQYIFRLPYHEPAAIFDGWSLQPEAEITADQPRKLQRLNRLLVIVEHGLQNLVQVDTDEREALYASTVPCRSVGRMTDDDIRGLLGE